MNLGGTGVKFRGKINLGQKNEFKLGKQAQEIGELGDQFGGKI